MGSKILAAAIGLAEACLKKLKNNNDRTTWGRVIYSKGKERKDKRQLLYTRETDSYMYKGS